MKLTPALEALLLLKLPELMALPNHDIPQPWCGFCYARASRIQTIVHTVDCLGIALLERLGKKESGQ